MAISGSDPSGGAGIQADIETLASMGCHTAPVVTALTLQNTHQASGYVATDATLLERQIRMVCADLSVAACKIGMIGSAAIAAAAARVLAERTDIPVVLDPVLGAGGGGALADDAARHAILGELLPLATVVTPNTVEARQLAPAAGTLGDCALTLLDAGAEYVLLTGSHEQTEQVINSLYGDGRLLDTWSWERLPGSYHGSGCTLAAAIAGLLATGVLPEEAIRQAQEYTWESLRHAYSVGGGQRIPNRFFWAQHDREARR
ncbi:MAG: hydroxymethylpyrimidine/phosphomethylpyrimidine kinase [Gammaproteobacteria bacterium]|nr:hydroxymethylpyrimidine/phosphomethylpyrimidine kinase [Gammaproteobacteria bacterium]